MPMSASRGLRVLPFGKKNIFMINGGVGQRGAATRSLDANHQSTIRN
jgi:hypothetical protein